MASFMPFPDAANSSTGNAGDSFLDGDPFIYGNGIDNADGAPAGSPFPDIAADNLFASLESRLNTPPGGTQQLPPPSKKSADESDLHNPEAAMLDQILFQPHNAQQPLSRIPTQHAAGSAYNRAFSRPPTQPFLDGNIGLGRYSQPTTVPTLPRQPFPPQQQLRQPQRQHRQQQYHHEQKRQEQLQQQRPQHQQLQQQRYPYANPVNGPNSKYSGESGRPAVTHQSATPALRVGQLPGVRDALAKFSDSSATFRALVDVIRSAGVIVPVVTTTADTSPARQFILNYAGFPQSSHPDPAVLTAFPRTDLDNLCWVLNINRQGRKADVARRIITLLNSPITASPRRKSSWSPFAAQVSQLPSSASGPANNADLYRMLESQIKNAHLGGNEYLQPQPSLLTQDRAPSEPVANARQSGSHRRINVVTQTQAASTSAQPRTAMPVARGQSAIAASLEGFDFMIEENPFNIPVASPLGDYENYVAFSAEQLNRGVEPALIFQSPMPRHGEQGADHQVHLRCLRVESNKQPSLWEQSWPFPAAVRLNGHNVTINQALRYTSGKLAGLDAATNVSGFLRKRKSEQEPNKVVLRRHASTASSAPGSYVMFVQEVRVLSIEVLKQQVLGQSKQYWQEHYEKYRAKQAKKMMERAAVGETAANADDESELSNFELARRGVVQFMNADDLCSSSMKVSLRCPLMLARISIPVKGRKCLHVQCFDLEDFLTYTRRSPKFACPVCNKPNAMPSELVVSPYIERALLMFSCDEVEVGSDGSLTAVAEQRSGVRSDDDGDNSDNESSGGDDVGANGRSGGLANGGGKSSSNASGKGAGVVDLTLSDDDDDEPLALPRAIARRSSAPVRVAPTNVYASAADDEQISAAGAVVASCNARQDLHATTLINASGRGSDVKPPIPADNDSALALGDNIFDDFVSSAGGHDGWGCDVIALDSD
jgi:hypothetical protein